MGFTGGLKPLALSAEMPPGHSELPDIISLYPEM